MPNRGAPSAVVLDVWRHIEPRFGGVGPAASALASAVERCSGIRTRQIAMCDQSEESRADGIAPVVEKIPNPNPRVWADFRLRETLQPAVASADICHVHGLWVPHCLAVRRLARQMNKPVVSSVHGMLEHWELHNKRLKKLLYSCFFERPSLSGSFCLRALSEHEVGDYRKFGIRQPIALVPNGINPIEPVDTSVFLSQFPDLAGKSLVLFLARLHRRKGIINLLRAWKTVAERNPEAHLVIAGPDSTDTAPQVKELIAGLGLQRSVTKVGVVSGQSKLAALSAAKYFCLPSFSEGFSIAVLEALSIGLPPIITPECNIPIVGSSGAGIITSNEPGALAETLTSCLNLPSRDWRQMQLAARKLARSEFDWNALGKKMQSVYEWLLGGVKPDCIVA